MGKAIYVIEHKTTSKDIVPGSPYWQRLTLDDQVSTYLEGAKLLGHTPHGLLYDVIRKPGERPALATPVESRKYTKDGALYKTQRDVDESPEDYGARIMEKISENPDAYFQRSIVVRIGDEARVAAQNAWIYAQQIMAFRKSGNFPQNVDACEAWGRFCEFWDVCTNQDTLENSLKYRKKEARNTELSSPLSDSDDGKRRLPIISASALREVRRCPKLYQYKYELGYETTERSGALHFGTLFHLALEAWWKSNGSIEAALLALSVRSDDRGKAIEVDAYDEQKARALMLGYHARWSETKMNVLAVEKEFSGPLVNPETDGVSRTFERGGKMDAIAEMEF